MKYIIFPLLLFLLFINSSCRDDFSDFFSSVDSTGSSSINTQSRSALEVNDAGYFVANRRVPLVGEGRVVNDLSPALISVINGDTGIGNIVDTDLINSASFGGVASIDLLGNQIASVKDVNLIYAGGQEAGFIYRIENSSLLTIDLLKGFVVSTYLNGELQESKGGDLQADVLSLNLITFAGGSGNQSVSISTTFSKPFNEIKLNIIGISADVLSNLSLYYAFVGENPLYPCVKNSEHYPESELGERGWPLLSNLPGISNLVDEDLDNAMLIGSGISIGAYYATVNLQKEVPAGYEIGFYTSAFDLLNLTLGGGFKISTYDDKGTRQEEHSIGSLLGLSLIEGSSASLMSMITSKPCSQVRITYSAVLGINIGGTSVYYAYVRDPDSIDISSYYALSNAETHLSNYRFHLPTDGSVVFSLVDQPSGASAVIDNGSIVNMNVPGDYKMRYTYSRDGESFVREVIVTKLETSINDGCNTMIARPTFPEVTLYAPTGGGSLITLENTPNASNLIDENPNNYVDYFSFTSIAANTSIVAVSAGQKINSLRENVRTGFTFQTTNNFLGADVLKFFVIRLYNDGAKVYESVADNNSSVGVGLIGSNSNKVRINITTDVEYDSIELWTAGVLNLNLSGFRLYNAFWEPTANCLNSIGNTACMEIMSQSSHGAEISYERTGTGGVIGVGSSFNELGNIIDTDRESYATLTFSSVIGKATLGVKFNELPAGQAVGFIIQTPVGIADVDLISGTKIILYKDGVEVASTGTGGLLGLDLIGYDGLTYIETTASLPYDEVVLEFEAVLSLLNWVRVYAAFTRADSNGDGIPDCVEPELEPEELIVEVNTSNICEGDAVELKITSGGNIGDSYVVICYNYTNNNEQIKLDFTLSESKIFSLNDLPPGNYYFTITTQSETILYSGLNAKVHPKITTWKDNAISTDWNEWSNWTNGSPWDCTDVILSKESVRYPILKENEVNYCANIYFEPNTEVGNIHLLIYSGKAYIDMELTANNYVMLAAPLKSMVTGDMFIPASMNGVHSSKHFEKLDESNSPENRFNPRIYQRMWNKMVYNKLIGGGDVSIAQTQWSNPYNALGQEYILGDGNGFSLWVDNGNLESDKSFVFKFPKTHTIYNYVTDLNQPTQASQTISRNAVGRFISENSKNETVLPMSVTLKNQSISNQFIVGNPFMTHIDIASFITINSDVIRTVRTYDGNTYNSVSTGEIAPMQSFFIETKSEDLTNVSIKFTAEMLTTKYGSSRSNLTRGYAHNALSDDLKIEASTSSITHSVLLRHKPGASDEYKLSEDSEILFDGGVEPTISIFTIAGSKALDFQAFDNLSSIPIGIYVESPIVIQLKFTTLGSYWSGWILKDKLLNKSYSMSQLLSGVNVGVVSTSTNRFELVKL